MKVREILKAVLTETEASNAGVLRTGGQRHKKARICAIGAMFRKPTEGQEPGQRNLSVGRRELIWEFSPGTKNPDSVQLRIVSGEQIREDLVDASSNIFKRLKAEGAFDEDYGAGLAAMLRDFVKNQASIIISPNSNTDTCSGYVPLDSDQSEPVLSNHVDNNSSQSILDKSRP